jgi:hypothetical protein
MRLWGAILVVAAAASAAVAPAGAAPNLRAPAVAGPTAKALPSVAIDPNGNAAIAYVDGNEVKVASRAAGGAWGEPQRIADAGFGDIQPFAGFDGAGNLTVVWGQAQGEAVFAASRPAGAAAFGPQQQIGDKVNPGLQFHAAFARSGAVLVVWKRTSDFRVGAVRRPAGGGGFEPQQVLGPDTDRADSPRAAAGEDGTVAVTWHSQGSPPRIALWRAGAGGWDPPFDLGGPVSRLAQPVPAVDPSGNVLAAWLTDGGVIAARVRSAASGTFGPADQIADLPGSAYGTEFFSPPQLAFDGAGNATILFSQYPANSQDPWRLYAATRPAGKAFGEPVGLNPDGEHAEYGRLAVAPDGTTLAAWRAGGGRGDQDFRQQTPGAIKAVTGQKGTWGGTHVVSPSDAYQPAVGLASAGAGAVAWIRLHDSACRQLESSELAEGAAGPFSPPPRSCDPPDVTPPQAVLGGKTKQRPHTTRRVDLTISCDEACSGTAAASLTLKPRGRKSSKAKLSKVSYSEQPGGAATRIRFTLTRALATRLAAVLRGGGSATLAVSTSARDAAGNATPAKLTVRLVR